MNYEETLTYIHSLDKFGSRPGLDRIKMLFDKIEDTFGDVLNQPFIHVAGTNGKGSVCTMLSSVLQSAGHKVGLFISPYIVDFRERVQINNQMVSKEMLSKAVNRLKPLVAELNENGIIITEFEFLTAVAFYIYRESGCDLIVCETGMGGLLDSTNLIPHPLCSVITRVDLDHTAILGDTIEKIAVQKAGIIKDGCVTVSAAQKAPVKKIIAETAKEKSNPLYLGEDIKITAAQDKDGTAFDYMGEKMLLPLLGEHQLDNLRCVLAVINALNNEHKIGISAENIKNGLKAVNHPARFEKLCDNPTVILDGAHNPNGLEAFRKAVQSYFGEGEKTLVIGMLADKDSASLHFLSGLFTHIIATNVNNPRALSADELTERLQKICDSVETVEKPNEAFDRALKIGSPIFVCGSLYLASELRPYILKVIGNN